MAASSTDQDQSLTLTITLHRNDEAGFQRFLSAVKDPSSPAYRHYLTQSQLADRFGPTQSSYDAVTKWVRSEGLTVTQRSTNRLTLTVKGTRAVAERAFQVGIHDYRVDGRIAYANDQSPAVPQAIAPVVQSVAGLSTLAQPAASPGMKRVPPKARNACSKALDDVVEFALETSFILLVALALAPLLGAALAADTFIVGGMTGYGLATSWSSAQSVVDVAFCAAYWAANSNWPGKGNGAATPHSASAAGPRPAASAAGQKIGLLEFDTYRPSDVSDWFDLLGLPDPAKSTLEGQLSEVPVNGGVVSPGPGQSEVLVDIDSVMATAPSPSTRYVVYDAPQSTSFETMFNTMIDDGDTVISNSWQQCEDQTSLADAQAIDSILADAAASGITVLNGSGDAGSTCSDGSPDTVGVPADSPNATAVGGTSPTFGPFYGDAGETWWGDSATPTSGQGGFGVSKYFARPALQNGLTASPGRSVPDLAMNADPNAGIQICEADAGGCPENALYGGTSMSTPQLAALVGHLNDQLGSNIGNLNAALYPQAGTNSFHTIGGADGDFAHVGLGSPDFVNILQRLTGTSTGAVSGSASSANGMGTYSDGTTPGFVQVRLRDGNGNPVGGKHVTLTPVGGGNAALVTPVSAVTDPTDGQAVFDVTDTVAQTATFTATDTTDSTVVTTQPTVTFAPPPATSGSIAAAPPIVANDGSSTATITVTLHNGASAPAQGKTVTLSEGPGDAQITPTGPTPGVTDSAGHATFTATDKQAEAVTFSAVDTTDGDLPIPGTATVTFSGNPSAGCSAGNATGMNGSTVTPVLGGIPTGPQGFNACEGAFGLALDGSGHLLNLDQYNGNIYKTPLSGGAANPSTQIGPSIGAGSTDLTFGNDGELYASVAPGGGFVPTEVDQIDPDTGAVLRTLTSAIVDPTWLATDPLTGDLFVSNGGSGSSLFSPDITRIEHPSSATPTITTYASDSQGFVQLAFAPNGTLYAETRDNRLVSFGATNTAQPVTETTVTSIPTNFGLAIGPIAPDGVPTSIFVSGGGAVYQVALPSGTATQLVADGVGNLKVGPDGCLYASDTSSVIRLTSLSATCDLSPTTGVPQITLTGPGVANPKAGSDVTFTARLQNVPSPAGTPVRFVVAGANGQVAIAEADSSGVATYTYAALHAGADTVQATATIGASNPSSNLIQFTWAAGKDTTYITLNGSPEIGSIGQAATVTAQLADISQDPPTAINGATIHVSLGSQTCVITTGTDGSGTCPVTPAASGMVSLTATYAGTSSLTASSTSTPFVVGGPSTRSGSYFHALAPVRILDSRAGAGNVGAYATPWVAGTTRSVAVGGLGGVPVDADSVVLNVTVTDTTGSSFLTLWPTGQSRPTASSLNWIPGEVIPNSVTVKLGTSGNISVFNYSGSTDVVIDVAGYYDGNTGDGYTSLSPVRILDSRAGAGNVGAYATPWVAGTTRSVAVGGLGGVPVDADSVVLNVTVTDTTGSSFLTLWPTGQSRPTASSLNWIPGEVIPNSVTVKLGTSGNISVFNYSGSTDVVIDVAGYYDGNTGDGYTSLSPVRILDSRAGAGNVGAYATPWVAGTTRSVAVGGLGGVPVDADSVVLNVTVTDTTGSSFLTLWPTGQSRPTASSLNWIPGEVIPNSVTVKLGTSGNISVFNYSGSTDVVIDVAGYYQPGTGNLFHALAPVRILDSRAGAGNVGAYATPWVAGTTRSVAVGGLGGVPVDADSVVLNVTVTDTTGSSFLTLWPTGQSRPTASSLNWIPGEVIPNSVTVKLGTSGNISVFNYSGSTDVVEDVGGWFG